MFATILGQCDKTMKSQLEQMNGCDKVDKLADVTALLKMIKNAMCDTSDKSTQQCKQQSHGSKC